MSGTSGNKTEQANEIKIDSITTEKGSPCVVYAAGNVRQDVNQDEGAGASRERQPEATGHPPRLIKMEVKSGNFGGPTVLSSGGNVTQKVKR